MSLISNILSGEPFSMSDLSYRVGGNGAIDGATVMEDLSLVKIVDGSGDEEWSIERELDDDYLPRGAIYITDTYGEPNSCRSYVAFSDEPPCPMDFYYGDLGNNGETLEYNISCFNNQDSYGHYDEVLFGKDGQAAEDYLSMTGLRLAREYSAMLDFFKHKPNSEVRVQKRVFINEDAVKREDRCVTYDRSIELRQKNEKYRVWSFAQRCDEIRTNAKEGGYDHRDVEVGTAEDIRCFRSAPQGWGMWRVDYNRPSYNTGLVGTTSPEEPVASLEHVVACDADLDGLTDSASAEWLNAGGRFSVPSRSSYTEGMLKYFDGFFKDVKDTSYYVWLDQVPVEVNVQPKQFVNRGEALFSYMKDGHVETYKAEGYGYVHALTQLDKGVIIELEPMPL